MKCKMLGSIPVHGIELTGKIVGRLILCDVVLNDSLAHTSIPARAPRYIGRDCVVRTSVLDAGG